MNSIERFLRRMQARGFANRFVNRAFGALNVNRRLRRRRLSQLGLQVRARLRIQKIPEQKQIEMGCRNCSLAFRFTLLFENNSIFEDTTIKTSIEQTRDRVRGRFDYRFSHPIERRIEKHRHACLLIKLSHQLVKPAIIFTRQRLHSTSSIDMHNCGHRISLLALSHQRLAA